MKKILVPMGIALIAGAFMLAANASAANASTKGAHHMTKQQSKFAMCAHQSKGLKSAAHKKFMSQCLKGELKATTGKAGTVKHEKPKPPTK